MVTSSGGVKTEEEESRSVAFRLLLPFPFLYPEFP
jgi:hypothetical protein